MSILIAVSTAQRTTGFIILAVVLLGGAAFVVAQMAKGRSEVGAELELAPNRAPHADDEELETTRLDRSLLAAVGLLAVIGLALPLYWLAEPGRQAGAIKNSEELFVERGLDTYEVGAQCVNCHGPKGKGGVASYVINDEKGNFVDQVTWNAPALNTVLWRFSEDEVRYVLNYGRPGTPMAAWGAPGGGPLTTQQIDNVIDYLWSVQLTQEEMKTEVDGAVKEIDADLYERMLQVRESNKGKTEIKDLKRLDNTDELQLGEILFGLKTASGAYSCARCHIPGAAYNQEGKPFAELQTGRSAPNLREIEETATENQHFTFVMNGSELGKQYFTRGQGSGRMPGFGVNPNAGQSDKGVPDKGPGGMLSAEQVWAIVTYERELDVIPSYDPKREATAAAATGSPAPADAGAGSNSQTNEG